jgi:tetratricopeptide (TPR) repeat protein
VSLASQLTSLEDLGLLRSLGDPTDPEYLFRHTLFQETAYRSLLRGERVDLHRSVAQVLESAYPEERDRLAPILGYHFLQAGDEIKALDYVTIAAEVAAKVYANQEALQHYRDAIELARRVRPEESCLGRLYTGCGRVHELMGDFDGALQTYQAMETLGHDLGFPKMALQGRVAGDTLRSSPSSVSKHARQDSHTQETLRLAREAGDREAEARSLWNLMLEGFFFGLEDQSRVYGEQALVIAEEIGHRELQAFISNDLSRNYLFFKGRSDRGLLLAQKARELWETLDNQPMLADNLAGSGMFASYVGDYQAALDFAARSLAISEQIDNPWGKSYSQYHLNFVYAELGDFPEAIRRGEEALHWAEVAGFIVPEVTTRAFQAWIFAQLGQFERAIQEGERAVNFGRQSIPTWTPGAVSLLGLAQLWSGDLKKAAAAADELDVVLADPDAKTFPLAEAYATLCPMRVRLAQARFDEAEARADKLIELQTDVNYDNFHADALLTKAECWVGRGDDPTAWTWLEKALSAAERVRSKRTQWTILACMSAWSARNQHAGPAGQYRDRARAILTEIADKMDPGMRAGFLSTKAVADVWSK